MGFIINTMENMNISLSDVVRFFYFNAILITITLNVFPPFAKKLYTYGKNQDTRPLKDFDNPKSVDKAKHDDKSKDGDGLFDRWLNLLASLQLPHRYFTHFYVLSTGLQLFTLIQILTHSRVLTYVLSSLPSTSNDEIGPPQQSFESIVLCIFCMTLQSSRRLYESVYIQLPSPSKMSILIYAAGILHYLFMSLATWCESPTTLLLTTTNITHPSDLLRPPRINTFLALPCFILATGVQHDAQVYLSSLKKYSLPTHPLFEYTLSPHYLAECVVYGSLVVLGAPVGHWVNVTLFYVWVFVCVNQAFGARITREWYRNRFGEKAVEGKCSLVPFIF
ncbi:hypothetical protein TWF694_006153 [Orbilia ellipsospora]|uniref:Polyprenal reductase n=1 Tax=Orbilia ellipsospora TaxID=2528407 RepID=A0AAV9WSD0_9PEZI